MHKLLRLLLLLTAGAPTAGAPERLPSAVCHRGRGVMPSAIRPKLRQTLLVAMKAMVRVLTPVLFGWDVTRKDPPPT